MHFVLRGETRVISNSHVPVVSIPSWGIILCSIFYDIYCLTHMLRSCQFPVGLLYFAQVSTTFVVYSVTNFKSNGRKNGQYCIKT